VPKAKTKADLVKALDTYQAFLASKGDRNAFEGLYKRWHPKGIRLAQRLTGNAEEAKDVLQEASMTIARNIHRLEKPEQFSAWAYTIVRRRAADHIRSTIKAREASVRAARYQESPPQSCAETDLSLRQALSHLPSEEREHCLHYFMSTGLPGGTLHKRWVYLWGQ
jgi:RNA polymerase sigma-70 factor (ECF subfamily)